MQAVGVLGGVHPQQRLVEVEAFRQWVLNQEAVDLRIGVESIDDGKQIGLRRRGIEVLVKRAQAHLLAGFVLLAHVARAGAVVADENRSQPGHDAALGQRCDALGTLGEDRLGYRFTCKKLCRHRTSPWVAKEVNGPLAWGGRTNAGRVPLGGPLRTPFPASSAAVSLDQRKLGQGTLGQLVAQRHPADELDEA